MFVKLSSGPHQRTQKISFGLSSSNNNKTGMKRKKQNGYSSSSCSLPMVLIFSVALALLAYMGMVVSFTRSMSREEEKNGMASQRTNSPGKKNPNYVPKVYGREEWGDHGLNVERTADRTISQFVRKNVAEWKEPDEGEAMGNSPDLNSPDGIIESSHDSHERILTAYLEPIDRTVWKKKPLPPRDSTADKLKKVPFLNLNSCQRLLEQWPVDEYPQSDPFLPWIHDVFPTHDGKFIQFIAQNRRRCRTGTTEADVALLAHTEPQISLFQPVAIQRLNRTTSTSSTSSPPRYRLTGHEHADEDGMETRFICRFQPSGEETLSVYNFNYEWASFRKGQWKTFHEDGRDNKQIHTSQLIFQCPVPESLVETVRTGASVKDDYATLFVDLVPIRTPPRYGLPEAFLPPYYKEFQATGTKAFDASREWGTDHILPLIEDSGRWANIPICKPSLLTYGKQKDDSTALAPVEEDTDPSEPVKPVKQHHLVSCLWASAGYSTRGQRFAINDGQRRLLEWITYNKLIGVDHFYLYDNSGAFSDDTSRSLRVIADLFPDDVTVINWPARVCNNNPNNVDSVGERSSQYAAEASCRLRFGPHVEWISQFDIDEYLVPMANHTSILPLLEKLDDEGMKIVSFGSWRAWPRRTLIETPVTLQGREHCGRNKPCFELKIPMNHTILQTYNCDRQKPGEKNEQMPAEKQIYRPNYVKHHFIHYSTVTATSAMNKEDTIKSGQEWKGQHAFPDPLSRFGDEINEALMLHSKAIATQDTSGWETACAASNTGRETCRIGTPFPDNMEGIDETRGDNGWKFNCYVNHKIEDYWVPLLEENLKEHLPELAIRMESAS